MFRINDLNKMLVDAKYDFVSTYEIREGITMIAYIDDDPYEPTIRYFENKNGYAHPYFNLICNNLADARLKLYGQYLESRSQESIYRTHISIPSMGMLE